jgi:hypothetical protein
MTDPKQIKYKKSLKKPLFKELRAQFRNNRLKLF